MKLFAKTETSRETNVTSLVMTKAIKKNGDQVWHVCLRRRMHLLYLHSHAQAMRVGEPRPHDLNSAKA